MQNPGNYRHCGNCGWPCFIRQFVIYVAVTHRNFTASDNSQKGHRRAVRKMTLLQRIITIGICGIGTMLTRFLPFIVFSEKRPVPKYIRYLGSSLPLAVFGFLVVYCLKGVNILSDSYGIPEAIAIAATAILHFWKKNMLLSIFGSTACYMLLVQLVF